MGHRCGFGSDPCVSQPIIQYWHSPDPPDLIAEGLSSFAACSESAHLVFDREKAARFIAERLSGRELRAFEACAIPAMQADYFRCCAVFALGGIYVDADLRCVADPRPFLERCEGFLYGRPRPSEWWAKLFGYPFPVGPYYDLDNSPVAFRGPRHPFIGLALEVATANIEGRVTDGPRGVWVVAGPGVFTSIYLLDRLGSLDAFLEYTKDSVLEPTSRLFCEVVASHATAAQALAGIEILPRRERSAWVTPLPRRSAREQHRWQFVRGSIFR
jgi:Glycosyltransferase sugar-binding region containing DXD motif